MGPSSSSGRLGLGEHAVCGCSRGVPREMLRSHAHSTQHGAPTPPCELGKPAAQAWRRMDLRHVNLGHTGMDVSGEAGLSVLGVCGCTPHGHSYPWHTITAGPAVSRVKRVPRHAACTRQRWCEACRVRQSRQRRRVRRAAAGTRVQPHAVRRTRITTPRATAGPAAGAAAHETIIVGVVHRPRVAELVTRARSRPRRSSLVQAPARPTRAPPPPVTHGAPVTPPAPCHKTCTNDAHSRPRGLRLLSWCTLHERSLIARWRLLLSRRWSWRCDTRS